MYTIIIWTPEIINKCVLPSLTFKFDLVLHLILIVPVYYWNGTLDGPLSLILEGNVRLRGLGQTYWVMTENLSHVCSGVE